MPGVAPSPKLRIEPLTEDRWEDFERLFGPSGAYAGCWCMWWRLKRKELERNGTAGNRAAIREVVEAVARPSRAKLVMRRSL